MFRVSSSFRVLSVSLSFLFRGIILRVLVVGFVGEFCRYHKFGFHFVRLFPGIHIHFFKEYTYFFYHFSSQARLFPFSDSILGTP